MTAVVVSVLVAVLGAGLVILAPHAAGHSTVWITMVGQVVTMVILACMGVTPADDATSTAATGEQQLS